MSSVRDAASPRRRRRSLRREAAVSERRRVAVLVIGGAGFIGSHLVDRLIAEGEVGRRRRRPVDRVARQPGRRPQRGRAPARRSELRIHTSTPAPTTWPRSSRCGGRGEIYHLAAARRGRRRPPALGRVVHVDARRARGGPSATASPRSSSPCRRRRCTAIRRARDLPVKEAAARAARRARRGRQGDRRPARRVPRAVRHRVHRAGAGHRVRPAPASRRRRGRGGGGGGAAGGEAPRIDRRRAADAATSSSSTTSSTPSCGRAGGAAGWSSTSAPACRRRCATCGR